MSEQKRFDAQSDCPGGLAQTVKECGCSHLVPKLTAIGRAWGGNQRRAAIDQLDVLIRKEGMRPCTVMMKLEILQEMEAFDEAIETAQQLVEAFPDLASPRAKLATLLALKRDERAIDVFLQAGECYDENREADTHLMQAGVLILDWYVESRLDPLAAGALAYVVAPAFADERVGDLVRVLAGHPQTKNASILAGTHIGPFDKTGEADIFKRLPGFEEALKECLRGRMVRAAERLEELAEEHPGELELLREAARCYAGANQSEKAAAVLRRIADNPRLSDAWRLWVRSVLQWYEAVVVKPTCFRSQVVVELADTEKAMELLHAHDQSLVIPGIAEQLQQLKPPPKVGFILISQPVLTKLSSEEVAAVTPERVPRHLGLALVFGKQTDRPARLVMTVDAEDLADIRALLESILGDQIVRLEVEPRGVSVPRVLAPRVQWHPVGAQVDDLRSLVERCDQWWVDEVWPELPHPGLGGKTPREAKADPALADALAGAVFNLEVYFGALGKEVDLGRLRASLNVPEIAEADPWETPVEYLPLPQWTRVDLVKLGKEDAIQLLERALRFRYVSAVRKLLPHVAELFGDNETVRLANLYAFAANVDPDGKRSAELYEQGAKLLESAGEESFILRFLALKNTVEASVTEELPQRVAAAYEAAKEEEQRLVVFRLLYEYGFLQPSEGVEPLEESGASAAAVPAAESGLWTPDSDVPAEGSAPKKESKLWLPGMD